MKYEPGKNYFVFTVTDYWLGEMVACNGVTVTLRKASLVRDTGRLSTFFKDGKSPGMEIEPLLDEQEIEINKLAITQWPHPLLREIV